MGKQVYIVVTPFFPTPTSWRGPFCYDFVKALAHQLELRAGVGEWRVLVFKEGDGSDYEIDGIKVYTFKARRLPSNMFPMLFARDNERSFIDKVKSVGETEGWKVEDVAVCHAHTANYGIYPLAIKNLNSKCKALLHHHDPQSFGLNSGVLRHCWLYNMIQFPILRKMHEAIDCHVFISEMVKRSFLMAPDTRWTKYEGYKKQMRGLPYRPARIKDSIILHNGVDKSVFREVEGRRPKVEAEREFVIGCVGNFVDWKDQMTLIRAVAKLKDEGRRLRLRFVGSGPYLEECKRYAKEHNIDAEFLTEMRHEQLPDFYRSLDLFALPSYFEGFGCVFTEAHSSGVPFITCEGQGMDDILEVRSKNVECRIDNSWLCKPREPKDLAEKIAAAMKMRTEVEDEEWKNVQVLNEDQDINYLVKKFICHL